MLLILQPGTSGEGTLQKQYPEGQAEQVNALVSTECTDKLGKHWGRTWPPVICITLHTNHTKSRHHSTHLEERSLVKKDAFWAKSSINFKSSSSIMSSGRASSSSSSRFSAILEDDGYRLRSCTRIQTFKPNPAYTHEAILHVNLELINIHARVLCYPRKTPL